VTHVIRPIIRFERIGHAPTARAEVGTPPKWAIRLYRLGRSGTTTL
jgi:hypothetical protein